MTMTRGIGSPYYMAPEMLRGDKKYTRAVDIYSFGIMCVELWNERHPYCEVRFDTPFAFALYVLDEHRPKIRKNCPKDLVELVKKCWATDRLNRPPFNDVANVLEPIVESVRQSMADDVEHVKQRPPKQKKEKQEKPSTDGTPKKQKKNKGSGGHKIHSHSHKSKDCDIPLEDLTPVKLETERI